jgi:hypothetical protein
MAQDTAIAAEVYRCVDGNGKPAYTSNPSSFADCRPANLKVTEPNPDDVARAMDRRQRLQEQEREEAERARQERELRAKEAAAEAALRQARAAEEAAKAQRSTQYEPAVPLGYYPYWGYGRGAVVPPRNRHRHDFGRDFKPGLGQPPRDGGMKPAPRPRP